MIMRARIGIAGLTDLVARCYLRNAAVGAQFGPALDESLGWYSVDVGTLPDEATADHIRYWSVADPTIEARENLAVLQRTAALQTSLASVKNKTDQITSGSVTVVSPVAITGNAITVRAGDTWSIPITGLGDISERTKLWFSVNKPGQDDALAKLFIEETAGLIYLAGATPPNNSLGALLIDDETAGNITLNVDEAASKLLSGLTTPGHTWTIKMLDDTGVAKTLSSGTFNISRFGVAAIA